MAAASVLIVESIIRRAERMWMHTPSGISVMMPTAKRVPEMMAKSFLPRPASAAR